MNTAEQLLKRIEQAVLNTAFKGYPNELYDPIDYVMGLGGKRVRPLLVLMACDMFGGDVLQAINPALGIEVFHNFTLLHDDIMDKAPLRRGQATVHEKWNANIAILSGDTMFVKACQLIMQVPQQYLVSVLTAFYNTAIKVCEGQQLDMNFEQRKDVSIKEYEYMIELKTAVLLAASLQIGTILAGAAEEDVEKMYEFGRCIGIAFQLQDDTLDVYGHPGKFGKQVGGDILADKKTYLLLKALELEAASQPEATLKKITERPYIGEAHEKVEEVTAIFNSFGVRQLAEAEMQQYFQKGMDALMAVNVADVKKQEIKNLTEQLFKREA